VDKLKTILEWKYNLTTKRVHALMLIKAKQTRGDSNLICVIMTEDGFIFHFDHH
jgi:hypothetical protein